MNRIHSPVHRGTYPKTVCPPAINAEQQTTHPLEHTPPPALQSETTNSSNIGAYTRIEPDPPSNRISKSPERRDVPPVRPLRIGCERRFGRTGGTSLPAGIRLHRKISISHWVAFGHKKSVGEFLLRHRKIKAVK